MVRTEHSFSEDHRAGDQSLILTGLSNWRHFCNDAQIMINLFADSGEILIGGEVEDCAFHDG